MPKTHDTQKPRPFKDTVLGNYLSTKHMDNNQLMKLIRTLEFSKDLELKLSRCLDSEFNMEEILKIFKEDLHDSEDLTDKVYSLEEQSSEDTNTIDDLESENTDLVDEIKSLKDTIFNQDQHHTQLQNKIEGLYAELANNKG